MRRDCDDWTIEQIWRKVAQAADAETAIDEQIAVSSADVPGVATQERVDVRLVYERDSVQFSPCEPLFDYGSSHQPRDISMAYPTSERNNGAGFHLMRK